MSGELDFGSIMVGGVGLMGLVLGLTQFLKDVFKLEGDAVRVLSVVTGAVFIALWYLGDFLPDVYGVIFKGVVLALAGGLSAGGYYQLVNPALRGLALRDPEVRDNTPGGVG